MDVFDFSPHDTRKQRLMGWYCRLLNPCHVSHYHWGERERGALEKFCAHPSLHWLLCTIMKPLVSITLDCQLKKYELNQKSSTDPTPWHLGYTCLFKSLTCRNWTWDFPNQKRRGKVPICPWSGCEMSIYSPPPDFYVDTPFQSTKPCSIRSNRLALSKVRTCGIGATWPFKFVLKLNQDWNERKLDPMEKISRSFFCILFRGSN